jgi:hypothetical protein
MRNAKQPDAPQNDRNGLALLAFALSLGGLAVAADIAWMAPHASSATMMSTDAATQEQEPAAQAQQAATSQAQQSPQDAKTNAPADYFPSHFRINAKDDDESPAPSF